MKNFFEYVRDIDKLLMMPNQTSLNMILSFINEKKGIGNYYFKELDSGKYSIEWFDLIYNQGLFNKDKIENFEKYWVILYYVEKVVEYNTQNPVDSRTSKLNNVIDTLIESDEKILINNSWAISRIIFKQNVNLIQEKHINYLAKILVRDRGWSILSHDVSETVIPKVIDDKRLLPLVFDKIVLGYVDENFNKDHKVSSLVERYSLKDIFEKYSDKIYDKLGNKAIEISLNRIYEINKKHDRAFNIVTIPTIEDSKQRWKFDDFEEILIDFTRDSLLKVKEPKDLEMFTKTMLDSNHYVLMRLALFIINKKYDILSDLFWSQFKDFPKELDLYHETYMLVKENASKFTKEQTDAFIKYIVFVDKVEGRNRFLNLLNNENEYAKQYIKENDIQLEPVTKPEYLINRSVGQYVEEKSPKHISEIKEYSVDELVNFLQTYDTFDRYDIFSRTSPEGLANVLTQAVRDNPDKYYNEIDKFLAVNSLTYQKGIFTGFFEAYKLNDNIQFHKVWEYLENLFSKTDFWDADKYGEFDYTLHWMSGTVAEFVEVFTKTSYDNNTLYDRFGESIEKVLLLLAENAPTSVGEDKLDIVTSVLNSARGKVFMAITGYLLQYARTRRKDTTKRFKENFQEFYINRLKSGVEDVDFYCTLGQYAPNIVYLDKEWFIENIDYIFPKENAINWEAVMSGYLFYGSKIYKDIYDVVKKHGNFSKGITTTFKDYNVNEALTQYIGFGYVQDWEALHLEDSLMKEFLEKAPVGRFEFLVDYYWKSKEQPEITEAKIKALWPTIFNKAYADKDDNNGKVVLSKLIKWIYFLDTMEYDLYKMLLTSADFIGERSNLGVLMQIIKKKVDKFPKELSAIFEVALQNQKVDYYSDKDFIEILSNFYSINDEDVKYNTNKICDFLGINGWYFPKKLYFEYNPEGLIN